MRYLVAIIAILSASVHYADVPASEPTTIQPIVPAQTEPIVAPSEVAPGGTLIFSILKGLEFHIDPIPPNLIPLRDDNGNRVCVVPGVKAPGYRITAVKVVRHPTREEVAAVVSKLTKDEFLEWVETHNLDESGPVSQSVVKVGGQPGPEPEPEPEPDPEPPTPAPIPHEGFRVLIIEESAERTSLPRDQLAIILGREVRDYLDSACVDDGYRIYDKDVSMDGETQLWKAAMQRRPESTPWVLISNGKTGFEGPLPANPKAFIELCRRYEK